MYVKISRLYRNYKTCSIPWKFTFRPFKYIEDNFFAQPLGIYMEFLITNSWSPCFMMRDMSWVFWVNYSVYICGDIILLKGILLNSFLLDRYLIHSVSHSTESEPDLKRYQAQLLRDTSWCIIQQHGRSNFLTEEQNHSKKISLENTISMSRKNE